MDVSQIESLANEIRQANNCRDPFIFVVSRKTASRHGLKASQSLMITEELRCPPAHCLWQVKARQAVGLGPRNRWGVVQ
ncbi:hypothetical protein [Pseudomonas syringae]|uniref:hypothetical protein n=1 Tax=Pseudomonas syringae TaxID=317 RepID=UPI001F117A73|nr:hypothetical protein [Pseudomonas syringae]MCH5583124.1 hypothetical protein [Pseudomonas syringae pv. syringae]MCH5592777.1 hypothetical protein [Pseudomonas syringae pv. syringae]MDF5791028.1 hypothetical protein [Pseudomonas syringae pv. syringae]